MSFLATLLSGARRYSSFPLIVKAFSPAALLESPRSMKGYRGEVSKSEAFRLLADWERAWEGVTEDRYYVMGRENGQLFISFNGRLEIEHRAITVSSAEGNKVFAIVGEGEHSTLQECIKAFAHKQGLLPLADQGVYDLWLAHRTKTSPFLNNAAEREAIDIDLPTVTMK